MILRRISAIPTMKRVGFASLFVAAALGPLPVGLSPVVALASLAGLVLYARTARTIVRTVVEERFVLQAAAMNAAFAAAGLAVGVLFLNAIEHRFGTTASILALAVPASFGAFALWGTRRTIDADQARLLAAVAEADELATARRTGAHLPLLSCRGINFSYDQLQVLFDVDFTVDDGEMVALLGTNGAGKSTLLRVTAGIGLPSSGTVRFQGEDITYVDAERRVGLGIVQVRGGRAVFGSLDVVENLRTFGYSVRRDAKRVEDSIEQCLDVFPRLRERRSSLAANLSGGEQQMLGLSKALILQPRLLVIDELSLGLAPVVVTQLLEMVRRINAEGTAVVLVEQSVNIALSLVDHAYFMEKGQVRFDGAAADLLARDDLLRAVFLEGAAKGRR